MSSPKNLSFCPACSAKNSFKDYSPAAFLKNDRRTIQECSICGLSLLLPFPTGAELSRFYNQGYYHFNRHSEEGKGFFFALMLKRLKPKGKMLDIGCATGFFINGIHQHGDWEVYGQEMGKSAAAYARKKLGLKVTDKPIEKAGFPSNYFDFIHFNNVLEHVTNPREVMKEVGRILKPGGKLYLAVPNGHVDRFGYADYYQKFHKRGASMDGHLCFFSPKSIELLAQNSGLKVDRFYSSGVKRAMRVLGYWPQKKGWEKAYEGNISKGEKTVEKVIEEGKAYPKAYYLWKHSAERITRFPFYVPATYDFNIYLSKPK